MNREEAQQEYKRRKLESPTTCVDYMIDDIYDDFESRVCGNCKYYEDNGQPYKSGCTSPLGVMRKAVSGISKTFGCNDFERKDG